jgi:hypothetical protein
MAKVKIQGHASGTGILTVTAPNTSTDRTITLPDTTGTLLDENSSVPAANLTGTVADARISALTASKLTGALPAISGAALTGIVGGKVLQVVYSNSNTATYPTTSYTTIASASISITPSATSSKILYIFNCGGLFNGNITSMTLKLERGGSAIRTYERWGYASGQSGYQPLPLTFMYVDTPSTTSAVAYSLDAKEGASGGWEINDTVGSGPGALVMAIEIGA